MRHFLKVKKKYILFALVRLLAGRKELWRTGRGSKCGWDASGGWRATPASIGPPVTTFSPRFVSFRGVSDVTKPSKMYKYVMLRLNERFNRKNYRFVSFKSDRIGLKLAIKSKDAEPEDALPILGRGHHSKKKREKERELRRFVT